MSNIKKKNITTNSEGERISVYEKGYTFYGVFDRNDNPDWGVIKYNEITIYAGKIEHEIMWYIDEFEKLRNRY